MQHKLTGQGGKGSVPRKVDQERYDREFDRIFGKPKEKDSDDEMIEKAHEQIKGAL